MRDLLEPSSKRLLTLLEQLIGHSSISAHKLCEEQHCTRKTLLNDIDILNKKLFPAEIISIEKNAYSLYLPQNANIEFVYASFLKNSLEFKILEIISQSFLGYNDLSAKLFISESTLRRKINFLNLNLSKYDFQISSPPFKLVGNEKKIRNFLVHFFSETYLNSRNFLPDIHFSFFNTLYASFISKIHDKSNFPDNEKFNFYIFVTLLRVKYKKHIKQLTHIPKIPDDMLLTLVKYEHHFKSLFGVSLNSQNINELLGLFFNDKYLIESSTTKIPNELYTQVEDLIHAISYEYKLSETPNTNCLVKDIYNFSLLNYGSDFILFDRQKFFCNLLGEIYHQLDSILCKYYNIIPEPLKTKKYALIYMLITHWTALYDTLHYLQSKLNVLLIFNTDSEHIHLLKKILSEQLPNMLNFKLLSNFNMASQEDLKNIDLILSDFPVDLSFKTKNICISILPTNQDIKKIDDFHHNLFFEPI